MIEQVRPVRIPTAPPIRQSTTASTRNCRRMLAAFAPTAIRRPISRVRSVTETSMMFMMPTPPTTSEIKATHNSRLPISFDVLDKRIRHLGHVANVEVVRLRRLDAMPLAQQLRDLVDCLRDFLGRGRLGQDLIHVDEADRLRRVGRLTRGGNGIRGGRTGVQITQRVDGRRTRGRVGCGRRGGALVDVRQRAAADAVFDRRPGGQDDVVLVHAHHVGPFARENADDLEGDVLHADFLADRRLALRRASRTIVWPTTQTLFELRTSWSLNMIPSSISRQSRTSRNAGDVPWM